MRVRRQAVTSGLCALGSEEGVEVLRRRGIPCGAQRGHRLDVRIARRLVSENVAANRIACRDSDAHRYLCCILPLVRAVPAELQFRGGQANLRVSKADAYRCGIHWMTSLASLGYHEARLAEYEVSGLPRTRMPSVSTLTINGSFSLILCASSERLTENSCAALPVSRSTCWLIR